MSNDTARTSLATWVVIAAALTATTGLGFVLVRSVPMALAPPSAARGRVFETARQPGVQATVKAGTVSVQRYLPAPAFALEGSQTLDPRLPPGPFTAELQVTIDPGPVRRARIGAEVQGGTLSIERRGTPLVTADAAAQAATVMSEPVYLPGRLVTFVYRFEANGGGPVRLHALWRPQHAQVDLPLPADGAPLLSSAADQGLVLVQRLNCVACHDAGEHERLLSVSPAPRLERVGERVRPGWIRSWLRDPGAVKRGATMPALFGPSPTPDHEQEIEDLVHLLVSFGGPMDPASAESDVELLDTGRLLYERVGCVACHGPDGTGGSTASHVSLGPLASKTTPDQLAAFLRDPVALRPSGRMPSLRLTELESASIASFLIQRDRQRWGTPEPHDFELDPQRVQRGRDVFAARGCADCHELGAPRPPIESTLSAPSLAALVGSRAGCLAEPPLPGVPDFHLDARQRSVIVAFLETLGRWAGSDVPHMELAATLDRLRCTACHVFHGAGGVTPEIDRFFTVTREADLGDEGRIPPDLSHVGARLNQSWLRAVLENGGVARPYMGARMPQYGADNVGRLGPLFADAAGIRGGVPDDGPGVDGEHAEIGRLLVGDGGFNCILCHSIAGRASANLPGPDLVQMVERLRWTFFSQWLHDPKQIRPGTRMPTFFSEGRSGLSPLDGVAADQIAAMWGYLSQGEFLPLPDGLGSTSGIAAYQIDVGDVPVVMRTFMSGVGTRAIACGYPQRIHCAFDAERCRLRMVWVGRFLNAAGSWAARGGSETDPEQEPVWIAADRDLFTGPAGETLVPRFRGYELDEQRRPIFIYDLYDGPTVYRVSEQPIPGHRGGEPSLSRRFVVEGPAGGTLRVASDDGDDRVVRLGDDGGAGFTLEVTW